MLPTNKNSRSSYCVAMIFALVGGFREPIRNESDPICSDSLNLDSNLPTGSDRLPMLWSHVESLKDIRAAARKCQRKGGTLARKFLWLSAEDHS